MDNRRLPKVIYDYDISLGLNSWGSEIKHIAASLGFATDLNPGETNPLTLANNIFLDQNRHTWQAEAFQKPKLRTFVNIHDFESKQDLVKCDLTRYQRSLVSQFKLGILPLKIETDRYQGIPPERQFIKFVP